MRNLSVPVLFTYRNKKKQAKLKQFITSYMGQSAAEKIVSNKEKAALIL